MKNLSIHILVRVLIIVVASILFGFVALREKMFFVPVGLIFLIVVVTIDLIRFVHRTNNDLSRMLLSIRERVYTDLSKGKQARPHPQMSATINEITHEFAKVSLEREMHYQYLLALNENINVAILSFDRDNNLLMMNPEATRLLKQKSLVNLIDLKRVDRNLFDAAISVQPGQKKIVRLLIDQEYLHVAVLVKELVLQEKPVKILLLQNINNELEAKELDAWQSLTRVLTHEIMNSVTPVAALSEAIQKMLTNEDGSQKNLNAVSTDNLNDIHTSISTIANRTRGLLRFVRSYKEFSRNMELNAEPVDLVSVVKNLIDLLSPDLEAARISPGAIFSENKIVARADRALLEQVLINVIKNALEATPHDGTGILQIAVKNTEHGTAAISIADNGPGMDEDTLSKIFIPFFTTKTNGTGIGLSLSKKIIQLHGGALKVQSSPGAGTTFTIDLPS